MDLFFSAQLDLSLSLLMLRDHFLMIFCQEWCKHHQLGWDPPAFCGGQMVGLLGWWWEEWPCLEGCFCWLETSLCIYETSLFAVYSGHGRNVSLPESHELHGGCNVDSGRSWRTHRGENSSHGLHADSWVWSLQLSFRLFLRLCLGEPNLKSCYRPQLEFRGYS